LNALKSWNRQVVIQSYVFFSSYFPARAVTIYSN
jgi:hypothetical protein